MDIYGTALPEFNMKTQLLHWLGTNYLKGMTGIKCAQVGTQKMGIILRVNYTIEEYSEFLSKLEALTLSTKLKSIKSGTIWHTDGTHSVYKPWPSYAPEDGGDWHWVITPPIPEHLNARA